MFHFVVKIFWGKDGPFNHYIKTVLEVQERDVSEAHKCTVLRLLWSPTPTPEPPPNAQFLDCYGVPHPRATTISNTSWHFLPGILLRVFHRGRHLFATSGNLHMPFSCHCHTAGAFVVLLHWVFFSEKSTKTRGLAFHQGKSSGEDAAKAPEYLNHSA